MRKAEKNEKTNKKQKHFWKDFKAELKKVIWPTKSQVVKNTIIVVVIVAIITAIVFVLDLCFEALNTYGIDKLKTTVQNSVVTDEDKDSESGDASSDEGEQNENENEADDEANVENNVSE